MSLREEMVNAVVSRIFPGRDPSKCLKKELCDNYLCRKLGLCCVDQKSDDQLEYVLTPRSSDIFLKACPGGGKTEVVGMKAAYEFQEWQPRHSGIAILTFTNNAADVIRARVEEYAGIEKSGHPHFIGTMDSWLHGYLANPFGNLITQFQGREDDRTKDRSIRLVEETASGDWLSPFRCIMPSHHRAGREVWINYHFDKEIPSKFMPLYAKDLQYDIERECWRVRKPGNERNDYLADDEYFASEAFQAFTSDKPEITLDRMRKGFARTKNKFMRTGFSTYHDIECICYGLLRKERTVAERLSHRFPFIIVDECQDLSWIQLELLGFLSQAGTRLHFVGDLNQAIYEFKQVAPEKVEAFISSRDLSLNKLTDNFRSCQAIVDVCGKLVATARVDGKESSLEGLACVGLLYKAEELSELPIWFETYLEERHIQVDNAAVLARGRTLVHRMQGVNTDKRDGRPFLLAAALYLWSTQNTGLWKDALLELGHLIASTYFSKRHSNRVRYYCPESVASPMQWRMLLARVLNVCSKHESGIGDLNETWKNWGQLVREYFGEILDSCLGFIRLGSTENPPSIRTLDTKPFRIPKGFGSEKVIDSLAIEKQPCHRVRITTIHSVKGETFDAILLVSSPDKKSKGGHWTQWLDDSQAEHARFAYVASSRPKYLLAWAIPIKKKAPDADLRRIRALGFTPLDIAALREHK